MIRPVLVLFDCYKNAVFCWSCETGTEYHRWLEICFDDTHPASRQGNAHELLFSASIIIPSHNHVLI